jgi:Sec-independent protein translocase protein TatA
MHFSEILVILLVALLVIKPAHLPNAAFTLGKWLKWLRQTTATLKRELEEKHEQK